MTLGREMGDFEARPDHPVGLEACLRRNPKLARALRPAPEPTTSRAPEDEFASGDGCGTGSRAPRAVSRGPICRKSLCSRFRPRRLQLLGDPVIGPEIDFVRGLAPEGRVGDLGIVGPDVEHDEALQGRDGIERIQEQLMRSCA